MARAASKTATPTHASPVQAAPAKRVRAAPIRNLESSAFKVGQDRPRDMPTDGEARLGARVVEVVDGPNWEDKAATLAFMEEEVEVMVHETTEENAPFLVQFWCNGKSQFFIRGQSQKCKRKFLEVIARAKHTSYRQQHYKDENGNDAIRNIPMTALRYPFTVAHDPNPKGAAWLRKVLAEV
jgi:hypothetical protein